METLRLERGKSDPVSYICTCAARSLGGSTLLFYRYWAASPPLPATHSGRTSAPQQLADWHRCVAEKYNLAGKLRIAHEGFNVTVAGTAPEIAAYITECISHWSFAGLSLTTEEGRLAFFKPSDGCACVFEKRLSVRVTSEITPMGVTGYVPSNWTSIESLSPADFHQRCHAEKSLLIDVRNHYESRIGYFVSPQTGEPALRPEIRRFSQWPQYVKHNARQLARSGGEGGRQILTYCTGGIRCEKGVRFLQEEITGGEFESGGDGRPVATLRGGVAAYLMWVEGEVAAGRMRADESLFRGRNYVFDGRGSVGLGGEVERAEEPVAKCHVCSKPSDHLSKCRSRGCHLILVVCEECDVGDPRCCRSCYEFDVKPLLDVDGGGLSRPICTCEQEREERLWGGERVKVAKTQGWRKERKKALGQGESIDNQIKTIV